MSEYAKTPIKDIFEKNKYKIFREFCKTENILYIESITEEVLLKFSKIKGVGEVRYKDVVHRLEELNIFLNPLEDKIPIDMDSLKKGNETILNDLKINCIFSDSKFRIFRHYCQKNGILTLLDMTNEDIKEFKNQRGIGKKRYTDFIEALKSIIERVQLNRQTLIKGKFEILDESYERCKDMKLSTLAKIFNLKDLNKDIYIRDIQGKPYDEISEFKTQDEISELETLVIKLNTTKSINNIINIVLNNLSDQESITIIARVMENLTLQETGDILEVSRERARQVEKRSLEKIQNIFSLYNGIESLKIMFNGKDEFSLRDLEKSIDDKGMLIINLIKQGKFKDLVYLDTSNTVYFYDKDESIAVNMA